MCTPIKTEMSVKKSLEKIILQVCRREECHPREGDDPLKVFEVFGFMESSRARQQCYTELVS